MMLGGAEGLDYVTANRQRGMRCGYLPQDGLSLSGRTVFAECLSVFSDIHAMERGMEELAHRMREVDHAGDEVAQIADRFHHIQAEIHSRDAYSIEAEVGIVLNGLGVKKAVWEERTEAFINRVRYQATKAKQVQSGIKEVERREKMEIPAEEKAIHFSFPQPQPSGRMVVEAKDVAKSYGAKRVFAKANFVIERGDRIALVGVNGAGKSTLIKLLAGVAPATEGQINLGPNTQDN